MQVGDTRVSGRLDQLPNLGRHLLVTGIQQHGGAGLHQAIGPTRDNDGADNAHQRVEPDPPQIPPGQQGDNRQHRSQGIGQHMHIGRTQVVVLRRGMVMAMGVSMLMPVVSVGLMGVMAVAAGQPISAEDIHRQPHHRNQRGFGKSHAGGLEQPQQRLAANAQRHQAQDQRRSKPGQITDLTRAETEPRTAGMTPGKPIGRRRNTQGPGVGGHVQTIRQQRHGTGDITGGNFTDHHHQGQRHHPQSAPRVIVVPGTKKLMVMRKMLRLGCHIHTDSPLVAPYLE